MRRWSTNEVRIAITHLLCCSNVQDRTLHLYELLQPYKDKTLSYPRVFSGAGWVAHSVRRNNGTTRQQHSNQASVPAAPKSQSWFRSLVKLQTHLRLPDGAWRQRSHEWWQLPRLPTHPLTAVCGGCNDKDRSLEGAATQSGVQSLVGQRPLRITHKTPHTVVL